MQYKNMEHGNRNGNGLARRARLWHALRLVKVQADRGMGTEKYVQNAWIYHAKNRIGLNFERAVARNVFCGRQWSAYHSIQMSIAVASGSGLQNQSQVKVRIQPVRKGRQLIYNAYTQLWQASQARLTGWLSESMQAGRQGSKIYCLRIINYCFHSTLRTYDAYVHALFVNVLSHFLNYSCLDS